MIMDNYDDEDDNDDGNTFVIIQAELMVVTSMSCFMS
jgi:hypothetical protein